MLFRPRGNLRRAESILNLAIPNITNNYPTEIKAYRILLRVIISIYNNDENQLSGKFYEIGEVVFFKAVFIASRDVRT